MVTTSQDNHETSLPIEWGLGEKSQGLGWEGHDHCAFVSTILISLSHKIQYSRIHENTWVFYQIEIWLIISKWPDIHPYFSSLFKSYTVFEGDILHFEKIRPCVSHCHVSLIPIFFSFPCPSHSHVSLIPLSLSRFFWDMGTTAITLPALTLTFTLPTLLGPGRFPCLSYSHVSLRVALRHGDHSYYLSSNNPYLDPPNLILGPGRFSCLSHSHVSLAVALSCELWAVVEMFQDNHKTSQLIEWKRSWFGLGGSWLVLLAQQF